MGRMQTILKMMMVIGGLAILSGQKAYALQCDFDLVLSNPHEVDASPNDNHTYKVSYVGAKLNGWIGDYTSLGVARSIEAGEKGRDSIQVTVCGNYQFLVKWKTENGNEHSKVVDKKVEQGSDIKIKLQD